MKIAIIDDGVGAFATLAKLKYTLPAQFVVKILDRHFPLGNLSRAQLVSTANDCYCRAESDGCDAVVFSSIALSMAADKVVRQKPEIPLFGCEAPILHAGTYTASQVLVVGDAFTCKLAQKFPNVIALPLQRFAQLADDGADDRTVTAYIAENAERFYGSFDCIALGCSCMNLYKHCFSRVFPNAQIFDSLEGVARKLRKKYKKSCASDIVVEATCESGENICTKYKFFADELC